MTLPIQSTPSASPRAALAALALALPALSPGLGAQRSAATLIASATVVTSPATMRALERRAGTAALESSAGAWRLSGRPGAPVGVAFTLPDTLVPAAAAGGPAVPLATARATARWQQPTAGSWHAFDAEGGTVAVIGGADDPSVRLALAWTPRPDAAAPRGYYLGAMELTLVYY